MLCEIFKQETAVLRCANGSQTAHTPATCGRTVYVAETSVDSYRIG